MFDKDGEEERGRGTGGSVPIRSRPHNVELIYIKFELRGVVDTTCPLSITFHSTSFSRGSLSILIWWSGLTPSLLLSPPVPLTYVSSLLFPLSFSHTPPPVLPCVRSLPPSHRQEIVESGPSGPLFRPPLRRESTDGAPGHVSAGPVTRVITEGGKSPNFPLYKINIRWLVVSGPSETYQD